MKLIKGLNTDNKSVLFNKELYLVIVILVIFFTFIGDVFSFIISFLYYPIITTSNITITNIDKKIAGLNNYESLKKEYDLLKEKIIVLEETNATSDLIKKENIQLKEQLKLNGYNNEIIQVETLDILRDENTSIVNKGFENDIKDGDIAYIGNMLIGSVYKVDANRAKIKFINASGVSMKGSVLSKKVGENISLKNIADKYMQNKLVDVVIMGKGDNIVVENIPFGKASVGDIIVVADERYDRNYIVGYIATLDQDMAKATQSGTVKQFFDIYSLSYYYLNK